MIKTLTRSLAALVFISAFASCTFVGGPDARLVVGLPQGRVVNPEPGNIYDNVTRWGLTLKGNGTTRTFTAAAADRQITVTNVPMGTWEVTLVGTIPEASEQNEARLVATSTISLVNGDNSLLLIPGDNKFYRIHLYPDWNNGGRNNGTNDPVDWFIPMIENPTGDIPRPLHFTNVNGYTFIGWSNNPSIGPGSSNSDYGYIFPSMTDTLSYYAVWSN